MTSWFCQYYDTGLEVSGLDRFHWKWLIISKYRNNSILQILVLVWAIIATFLVAYPSLFHPSCPYKWNGGNPLFQGSCWCGWDSYCQCTPSLAIEAIIEVEGRGIGDPRGGGLAEGEAGIVLIIRRDPPRDLFAIPGGFVEIGETVEAASTREVKEETNLDISSLEQFRVYSCW